MDDELKSHIDDMVEAYDIVPPDVRLLLGILTRLSAAEAEANDLRERLHDVVMIEGEAWATGGGPGFKERKEKAWNRAREPFEP